MPFALCMQRSVQMSCKHGNNISSSPYYPVQFMSLLCCAITKPGGDTAFNSASVEHDGWDEKIHLPQSAERVLRTALVLSLEVNSSEPGTWHCVALMVSGR